MRKKQAYLYLAVTFGLLVLAINIGNAADLSIESLTIAKPVPSDCAYTWQAVIKNKTSGTISGTPQIAVQGAQGYPGGTWSAASGVSLGNLGPGQTVSKMATFTRKASSTQFKLTLYSQGNVIAERMTTLAPEPPPSVAIENCTTTSTGYSVNIRNLSSTGLSDIVIQGSAASSANPNAWVAAGGTTVQCIKGGGTYLRNGPRPAGYNIIKIQVRAGSTVIAEKVLNCTPAPTATSSQPK